MGVTKTKLFSADQNNLASLAKVLGHPARIAILQYLILANECICNDLVNEIGLAQPTISQHLKELKTVGIIRGEVEGTSICYCIDRDRWLGIKKVFETFFVDLADSNKLCC
jgi:DNA-binding transcriptional ArsR family regulator